MSTHYQEKLEKLINFIENVKLYTREGSKKNMFFTSILHIINDIEESLNDYNFKIYNQELQIELLSDYNRHVFAIHPEFRLLMADYLHEMEKDSKTMWPEWWPSVFSSEFPYK